jgi:glycosyltransferase involved in cell wall biosynthesis
LTAPSGFGIDGRAGDGSAPARVVVYLSGRANAGGGGETYLLGVLRHLDRSRFRPLVVLPGNGTLRPEIEALGVDVHVIEANYAKLTAPRDWYGTLRGLADRVRDLAALLRGTDARLVHTNTSKSFEGALAAALAGVHHVYVCHSNFESDLPIFRRVPLAEPSFAQAMGELSTTVIAVAPRLASRLCPPIEAEKVRVIMNGLELDTYERALAGRDGSIRASLGIAPDAPVATAVGRISPEKGFASFVEAAAIAVRRRPDLSFLLAGQIENGEHHRQLMSRVRHLGLERNLRFLGYRTDVPALLAESDMFVLSSEHEGGPYVLIEAMLCACAPIATRCGGIVEETVLDGETGYLVDVGDAVAIADRMIRLCDRELCGQIAARARAGVVERFDIRQSVGALMDAYDATLAQKRPVAGSIGVDLLLQAAQEIGSLGLQVAELERRLGQLEGSRWRGLGRGIRKAIRSLRGGATGGP